MYYIPISLASHFGENFMKFGPNIAKLQMFTFTSLCSVFVLYEIKMENMFFFFVKLGIFCPVLGKNILFGIGNGPNFTNHNAQSLDIWFEASPSEPLPSLFKLYLWGQKWPHPRGHMIYIGLYREKHEKIFLSETIRLRALIFCM